MNRLRVPLLFALLLLGAARVYAASADETALDRNFERSTLQIATPDARLHRFNVWIADRESRQQRGLMYVKTLAADAGMLFIYPSPRRLSMWMKNTYVPLDMLFVDTRGCIVSIAEQARPLSLKSIQSGSPVVLVVEIKGGGAATRGAKIGDRVLRPDAGWPPSGGRC